MTSDCCAAGAAIAVESSSRRERNTAIRLRTLEPRDNPRARHARRADRAERRPAGIDFAIQQVLDRAEQLEAARHPPAGASVDERCALEVQRVDVVVELRADQAEVERAG